MKIKITLFLVLLSVSIYSQNIIVDTSFGNNGTKPIELNGEADYLRLVNVNNTSLLAYSKTYLITNENSIYKIDLNGNLDNSFGTNGALTLPNYKSEFKVLMQGNDKFIVSFSFVNPFGTLNNERAILRYNLDGSLDTTFGTNGELRLESISSNYNDIVVLDDLSILIKDSQKIIKILSNGNIDTSFGNAGSVTNSLVSSINKFQNDILLQSSTELHKLSSEGIVVNEFATNGVYNFTMNDYTNKVFGDKILTIEEGNLPVNLYFLNANGQLNNSFDNDGILNISDQSASLSYINDFLFINNKFFLVGETSDIKPFILSYDLNGNLVQLNSSNFYKENNISNGSFTSIVSINDKIYVGGDYFDPSNNKWYYIISKYDIQNLLSNQDVQKVNSFKVENPVSDKLNILTSDKINDINIYSLDGRLIFNNIKNNEDVSFLKKGVYFLKITTAENKNEIIRIIKK